MDGKRHDFEPGFTHEHLPESTHVCLIFDDEDQRLAIVSEYLAAGLRGNERTRWFYDISEPDEARRRLAAAGIDVAEAERGSLTLMPAERAYCPDGYFDPDAAIARMQTGYEASAKAGFKGQRTTGEMSWSLKGLRGSERLLEYEAKIATITTSFPHTGMCQYDSRRFDGATLFKVLQLHPFMVARGQIVRNPYYLRSQELAMPPVAPRAGAADRLSAGQKQ
jgi:hypothetical protein